MKKIVVRMLEFVAYWSGLDSLFYYLNRKSKRVVTFHNVLRDEIFRPGLANGVSNSLTEFRMIVSECSKRFGFSTDIADPSTLTITFDDGYRNQYSTAFSELRRLGVPAYLFVAGNDMNTLTIDKLLIWVSEAPIDVIPGENRFEYWCNVVWPGFVADSGEFGQNILAQLDSIFPMKRILDGLSQKYINERLGRIRREELCEMKTCGWKIGWHTQNHVALASLSDEMAEKELTPPDEFEGECLSFPFGNICEVGERAVETVRRLGYPCAFSDATISKFPFSKWFLPRFALESDKYSLHFDLSGLRVFMKTGKLLPVIRV